MRSRPVVRPMSVIRRKRAVSWPKRSEAPWARRTIMSSASSAMCCQRAMLARAAMPSLSGEGPLQRFMRWSLASWTACISSRVIYWKRSMSRGTSCMSLAMVWSSESSFRGWATRVGSLNSWAMKRSGSTSGSRTTRRLSACSSAGSWLIHAMSASLVCASTSRPGKRPCSSSQKASIEARQRPTVLERAVRRASAPRNSWGKRSAMRPAMARCWRAPRGVSCPARPRALRTMERSFFRSWRPSRVRFFLSANCAQTQS